MMRRRRWTVCTTALIAAPLPEGFLTPSFSCENFSIEGSDDEEEEVDGMYNCFDCSASTRGISHSVF
jgi:hypothetical protein